MVAVDFSTKREQELSIPGTFIRLIVLDYNRASIGINNAEIIEAALS